MKEKIRQQLVQMLWDGYKESIPFYNRIFNENNIHLDHFAIIDLPSENSGMNHLKAIFSSLGFVYKGEGYLPEKHNPFAWMREDNYDEKLAHHTTAQPVIADFKLDALSPQVRHIVEKYAALIKPLEMEKFEYYKEQIDKNNEALIPEITGFLYNHLIDKERPKLTSKEYETVFKENELIAWVLAFGRVVNHFGVSIHLDNKASNLTEFNDNVLKSNIITLNATSNYIKGGEYCGIAQSSTNGLPIKIRLKDKEITTHNSFLEFVWRYSNLDKPTLAKDYYCNFIPQNANHVIESLYIKKTV
ncbi:Uncharacterized protein NF27_DP00110 [Candidatus Jidaibacter acanthamoeba]|uniref:2-oxoadipate dioxygenase/decarboxylase n=1 Tax=Candidatus Jidaibacter acanthamoebae TaxID=86105 RepID=A0A0C1MTR0_9RICK|nr:DUF1338 family protein [Candidatus Jidaibacter acanthamoeba]KIE05467.1 Uncharacterized protein NF27_DP00110 [Candidatus Jidaibacter acanthamoeba]